MQDQKVQLVAYLNEFDSDFITASSLDSSELAAAIIEKTSDILQLVPEAALSSLFNLIISILLEVDATIDALVDSFAQDEKVDALLKIQM